MKKFIIVISSALIGISCGNPNSKPSVQDNSARKVETEVVEDYSGIESEKLLRHIQAHYDLGEYSKGKQKLSHLMITYPDSLDGVDLTYLKIQIDQKLEEKILEEQALAEKERLKRSPNAVNNMRVVTEGTKMYYYDKSSPEFDTKECFYAYIVKDVYGPQLYFKIRYVGTDWVNIENFLITADQLDYTLEGEIQKRETKGKKKYKHELFDKQIKSQGDIKTLKAIANAEDVLALFVGSGNYKKRVITKEQRTAIRNVLDAYIFMGGTGLSSVQNSYTDLNE